MPLNDVPFAAGMDQPIQKRKYARPMVFAAGALLAGLLGYLAWSQAPQGLSVAAGALRIVPVERGVFRDDVIVRATAHALNSTVLDAVDRGRVEQVYVRDGMMVKRGDLLFRLSNPQRRMDLLQRQSEQAQQLSNLSSFKVGAEAARSEAARRLAELEFNLRDAQKQQERNARLAAEGFIGRAALQDASDKVEKLQRELRDERAREAQARATRQTAIARLEEAIGGMRAGLDLFNESIDALTVRAPVAGRLTDFQLQVGEAVKTDQRLGRIDEPDRFRLTALVDEYYLPRIAVGHRGVANVGGKSYPVEVKAVFPQVKDGRFTADVVFARDGPPGLHPGLSVDLGITLGEPAPALVLPNGAYLNDSGAAWVFVLDKSGQYAARRTIRVGRRNNAQAEIVAGLNAGERVIVSSYAPFGKAERLQLTD